MSATTAVRILGATFCALVAYWCFRDAISGKGSPMYNVWQNYALGVSNLICVIVNLASLKN